MREKPGACRFHRGFRSFSSLSGSFRNVVQFRERHKTPPRIWDLPTRIFHCLFAIAFAAAWLLGEEEGWLGWHGYFGYLVGGLIGIAAFTVSHDFSAGCDDDPAACESAEEDEDD